MKFRTVVIDHKQGRVGIFAWTSELPVDFGGYDEADNADEYLKDVVRYEAEHNDLNLGTPIADMIQQGKYYWDRADDMTDLTVYID